MNHVIGILILALLLTACETIVEIDYRGNQSKVVIEGNITSDQGPYFVKITRSIALSETGTYPTIDDAVVTISDDVGNSEQLVPEGNGTYHTTMLEGVEGRTYTLTAKVEDQTYTAYSTMPHQVPLDAIEVEEATVGTDTERDLVPKYIDPSEKGNSYRFVLTVNDKLINQHLIQNDDVKNGQVNTLKLEINDDDLKLEPGDKVNVTMQCIDKNVAAYYTTLVLMADSGPGGGATPSNPPTNISNGALGVFSAHTTEAKSVTIP